MTKLINRRFPILYTINLTKVDGEATKWSTTRRVIEDDHVQRAGVSHPRKKKAKAFSILIISINRSIQDVKSSVN